MHTVAPIGVFDSGVGGISTLAQMTHLMPHERFLYFGDSAHAPYGTKERSEVLAYVHQVMRILLDSGVKAVVIACNTATSVAAAELRAAYTLPIIGMEPALKPAHEARRNGAILVLATPMTLQLEKFRLLMERYGEGAIPLSCPGLMELIEQEDFSRAEQYLSTLFHPYDMRQVDAVVLGCTHYVFLRPVLQRMLPPTVQVLDGNLGTARQLQRVLDARGLLKRAGQGSVELRTSGEEGVIIPQMQRLYSLAQQVAMC